ncbi:nitrite reductase (NAD(P)H) small subunit [Evansella cellulosilytica]|uniref:Rieske (2Fe-2S) iron-sulfur domain n=1 Tax=Evansella cellulosilytica (strain ATCC 21833 / DSM 2522 / FERM P-1141 / JCM 9156 / N-4) TaxID=649639 RepID=E6TU75_EVAC2|nr:nitrite reductase (NAD(P)H) small subunit [Evansella cellulosilytica]ADU28535.1 Rieske (2Fe-2S) iron-sulfur domain [Evansella cellulosilytica DSM 2522]
MNAIQEKVKVLELAQLPQLIGKEVEIKGESIAIFHLSNGDVRAVASRCPHTNGPLAEGIVAGEFVYCPLQDWKVSLVTGEVQKPDDGKVVTYETEVIDGYVYVVV